MTSDFSELGPTRPDIAPLARPLGEVVIGAEDADDISIVVGAVDVATDIDTSGLGTAPDVVAEADNEPAGDDGDAPLDGEIQPDAPAPLAGGSDVPTDPPDNGGIVSAEGEPEPFLGPGAYARLHEARARFDGLFYPYDRHIAGTTAAERAQAAFDAEVTAAAQAAQHAQLTPQQTEDLLAHTINAIPDQTDFDDTPTAVMFAGHAVAAASAHMPDERLTTTEIDGMKRVITVSGEKDAVVPGLEVYSAACRAGLSPADSESVTKTCIETSPEWRVANSTQALRDVLRSVDIAGVDPTLLRTVVEEISTSNPEHQWRDFESLHEALVYQCPEIGITPNELLQAAVDHFQHGVPLDEANQGLQGLGVVREAEAMQFSADPALAREAAINRHFIEHPGPLVNAAMPYRTERSLAEGTEDLHSLADANRQRGEQVARGNWVHDPASGTWYSLGGRTVQSYTGESVNRPVPFDVSQLSDTPYTFTVHPRDMAYSHDYFAHALPHPDDLTGIVNMLVSATQPVAMRSYVATTFGTTELTYPPDPLAVADLAATMGNLRQLALLDVTYDEAMLASHNEAARTALANRTVARLNTELPDGFTLRFYPRGSDIAGQ
jgi:hypothetical protein